MGTMLTYKVVEIKQKSFLRGFMTAFDLQNAINRWEDTGETIFDEETWKRIRN